MTSIRTLTLTESNGDQYTIEIHPDDPHHTVQAVIHMVDDGDPGVPSYLTDQPIRIQVDTTAEALPAIEAAIDVFWEAKRILMSLIPHAHAAGAPEGPVDGIQVVDRAGGNKPQGDN